MTQHAAFSWTAGLAVVAIGLWLAVLQPARDDARVTFLDVGQGLAVLIEDDGQRVLFDTGPPDGSVVLALPSEVGNLDAVIVSHSDTDHAGGLAVVLDRLPVSALLAEDRTLAVLRDELPQAKAARPIDIGDRIHLSERTTIEVLSPPSTLRSPAHGSDNDGALVVLVTIGDRRVLVTADIEAAAEQWLIEADVDLRADVVLVPHHGSKTSSTPAFLEAIAPGAAVVSVGAGNPHGHPAEEVVARYEGVPLYRTDEDGNVTVTSDGERLWVRSER
jgi:competence protein ComEC